MATISAGLRGTGLFRAKKAGVVAGLVLLDRIFYFIDPKVEVRLLAKDGAEVSPGMGRVNVTLCEVETGRPPSLHA